MAGAKIIDLINARDAAAGPFIAFEYFPPRTEAGVANLRERFGRMKVMGASACSLGALWEARSQDGRGTHYFRAAERHLGGVGVCAQQSNLLRCTMW